MNELKFKIWVEGEEGVFLGNGRVRLLEAISKTGSITAAAKSMNMSYKKAWEQIDHMNECSDEPLVTTSSGGKGGGGTSLTAKGEQMVKQFILVKEKFEELAVKERSEQRF
ncbi:MAG: LysR family transcriptional regulator [Bacteroidia bacterium]